MTKKKHFENCGRTEGNYHDNSWNSASWLAVILEVAILAQFTCYHSIFLWNGAQAQGVLSRNWPRPNCHGNLDSSYSSKSPADRRQSCMRNHAVPICLAGLCVNGLTLISIGSGSVSRKHPQVMFYYPCLPFCNLWPPWWVAMLWTPWSWLQVQGWDGPAALHRTPLQCLLRWLRNHLQTILPCSQVQLMQL